MAAVVVPKAIIIQEQYSCEGLFGSLRFLKLWLVVAITRLRYPYLLSRKAHASVGFVIPNTYLPAS